MSDDDAFRFAVGLLVARERDAMMRRMSWTMYRDGWYVGPKFEAAFYVSEALRFGPNTAKRRRMLKRRAAMIRRGSGDAIDRAIADQSR